MQGYFRTLLLPDVESDSHSITHLVDVSEAGGDAPQPTRLPAIPDSRLFARIEQDCEGTSV